MRRRRSRRIPFVSSGNLQLRSWSSGAIISATALRRVLDSVSAMRRMTRYAPVMIGLLAAVFTSAIAPVYAQQTVFEKVKARSSRSDKDRRLVDKEADLVFDDRTRRLVVRCATFPLDISYDSIEAITFEVTTHMRGGFLSEFVTNGLSGMPTVDDYWFLISYRTPAHEMKAHLLELSRDSSQAVMDKAHAVLGDKVKLGSFVETSDDVNTRDLQDLQSKHDLKIDKSQHP